MIGDSALLKEKTPNVPGFDLKLGWYTWNFDYITGTVLAPNDEVVKKSIPKRNDNNELIGYSTVKTSYQNFHLLKDNGKEESVQFVNNNTVLREGSRISLVHAQRKNKRKIIVGLVNHDADEMSLFGNQAGILYTEHLVFTLISICISLYLVSFLDWWLPFLLIAFITTWLIVRATFGWVLERTANNRLEVALDEFMQKNTSKQ